jgi:hypothetical protein
MKKSIRLLFACTLLLAGVVNASAQVYYPSDEEDSRNEQLKQDSENERAPFLDKMFVGGGFGLSFGDVTFVQLMPIVGYRITPKLSGGVRFMYQYTSRKLSYLTPPERISSHDFGLGPFARMMLFGPVFAQIEYEYLNYQYYTAPGEKIRSGFDSFMAGGGIIQPIGGKAAFFLTALYNFSYNSSSTAGPQPYDSPLVLRAGITAGF